jgi:hypothetical protein
MGIGPHISHSTYDDKPSVTTRLSKLLKPKQPKQKYPNPNPKNFRIIRSQDVLNHLVVEVLYPDCTNYEGHKILVYRNTSLQDLCNQSSIDPHFSNSSEHLSPFARFEPTQSGWIAAMKMCHHLLPTD